MIAADDRERDRRRVRRDRAPHEPRERLALHVLHDEEELAVGLHDVERRHHVRVADARGEARLVEEHRDELGVLGELRVEALDRDGAREADGPDAAARGAPSPCRPTRSRRRARSGRRCAPEPTETESGSEAIRLRRLSTFRDESPASFLIRYLSLGSCVARPYLARSGERRGCRCVLAVRRHGRARHGRRRERRRA